MWLVCAVSVTDVSAVTFVCGWYAQVQWLTWMHGMPRYVVEPETKFADIIVPTPDTVRSSALLELLLKNNKTVSRQRRQPSTAPVSYRHIYLHCTCRC